MLRKFAQVPDGIALSDEAVFLPKGFQNSLSQDFARVGGSVEVRPVVILLSRGNIFREFFFGQIILI